MFKNKLNNKGQTLVEYVLLISLIIGIITGLFKLLEGPITDKITKTGCEIMGKEYVEGKKTGEGYCKGDEDKILE